MKFQFEGLSITCEDELRKLVERINCDTEFAKLLEKYGIKDEYIDEKEIIRVYRKKIGIHKNDFQREKKVRHEKPICPMDKTGDCPYGRPEGICIGIPSCYRDVIEGNRGGNGRNNRFTVYGIRDLGTELSSITMLVMMESIQQRIVENGKRGKATWLYIDEFHVLLNSEYSAKYLQQLWKKVRKQGGLCTGITQNVVDLLQNYTATTMLANSEFVALLKQANTDSAKISEVIGVSEAQLRFVTNSSSGMGLIKCGPAVIPFDNQISKDTDLYKLYNTNIHELIAERKAKASMVE